MKDKSGITINYIYNNNFKKESISNFIEIYHLNPSDLVFFILKNILKIENIHLNKQFIINSIKLIYELCKYYNFNNEEIINYIFKVKAIRQKMLKELYCKNDTDLKAACNLLDEIAFSKALKEKNLIKTIITAINNKKNISIIKKLLSLNKLVIHYKNNYLFNYIFNLAISSLQTDNYLITYYITLLKIFFPSNLNDKYYLEQIDKIEINIFSNEIRNIILGDKKSLRTEEIISKYDKRSESFITPIIKRINISTSNDIIFTIDRERTFIRDDALSIKKDGNNYIIKIFVTDVPSFIMPNSQVDINARNLCKNSYLNGYRVEMIPFNISSNLSLNKDNYRRALIMTITMNNHYEIIDYKLDRSTIYINENLSYNFADEVLLGKTEHNLKYELDILFDIANLFKERNLYKEKYWKSKHNNKNIDYKTNSHIIISEFIILYNILLSKLIYEKQIPYIYRAQDKEEISSLITSNQNNIDEFSRTIFDSIYQNSYYSHIPSYHYGINAEIYSHSSSPLRKYAALYNQYLVHKYIFNTLNFNDKHLLEIIEYINDREFETNLFEEEYNRAASLEKKKN